MIQAESAPPDQVHELRDGRLLAWCEYGRPDGIPVFYFHGIPGSRIDNRVTADAITAAGLRLIAPDRPGFGRSSLGSGRRSYSEWVDDIESLAELLGIERFAVVAYSAGGPYALAAGVAFSDRITHLAIVSGVAPSEMPSYRKGVGPTNRAMTLLAPRAPWLCRLLIGRALKRAREDPERFGKSVDHDFKTLADREMLDAGLRALLPELFLEAGHGRPRGDGRGLRSMGATVRTGSRSHRRTGTPLAR